MSDPALVSIRDLGDCGCCAGVQAETPAIVTNRPGLSAITYRVGTQAQFKQSMLAALSDVTRPALRGLTSRADDDFSIALLDAAATMADVLTFYQERIANESYLRTATERRSILELARLIGYELRPGVAASTYLAFTTDQTAGAPARVPIDIGTQVQSIPAPGQKPQTFETIEPIEARIEWTALRPRTRQTQPIYSGQTELYLAGVNTRLVPGDAILIVGDERLGNPTTSPAKERWDFRILETVTVLPDLKMTHVTWSKGLGAYSIAPAQANVKCFALRQRANLFGYNAPSWYAMSHQTRRIFIYEATGSDSYDETNPTTWGSDWPEFYIKTYTQMQIDLDAAYPKVLGNLNCAGATCSWVVLKEPGSVELYRITNAVTQPRSDFTISTPATRLTLDTNIKLLPFDLRATMVFTQSEELPIAEVPCPDLTGGQIDFDPGVAIQDLPGRYLAVAGMDQTQASAISEVVLVNGVSGSSVLVNPGLSNTYLIDTVTINANVAPATHGETVQEVLGNGAAGTPFQRFSLKQTPLTYISAANATGAESTLQVRVNDVLWHETPTLYGLGSKDRMYVTRRDDAGTTTVEFGDGMTGARLPSGQMNVRARYRRGLGVVGLLNAGQLSMLLSRPLGLKTVTNPMPSSGGQDPEMLDEARSNAPLQVMTLDRVVSLEDYEYFARAFAGIAKAQASWVWVGDRRMLYITVAGPAGNEIPDGSSVLGDLLAALQQAGDPFLAIQIGSYRAVPFHIDASLKIDPDYDQDKVLAQASQALLDAFSFDKREFAQPVFQSEVIALLQAVPGVIAVDINKLYRSNTYPVLAPRLLADFPTTTPTHYGLIPLIFKKSPGGIHQLVRVGQVFSAELLLLNDPNLIELGVMT
jgi:hypothetical protein